jgi:hypothetical protein
MKVLNGKKCSSKNLVTVSKETVLCCVLFHSESSEKGFSKKLIGQKTSVIRSKKNKE